MYYLSLYRKYRPQLFSEVIGQEHIVRILLNQIKNNKITHAYLFTGPRGVGKTSAARILARAINCLSTQNGEPCNSCEACKSIMDHSTTDVIEIDGASNNSVGEIRSLREKVLLSTAFLKKKVYIIDEIHMLTPAAFNALLKTLEEPPSHVQFIFATTQIHKIPLTIISRCQRFDFYRIWKDELEDHLQTIFKLENKIIEKDALRIITQLAKGGARDALGIAEQCISYSNENIVSDDVRKIYGILSDDEIVLFINSLMNCDVIKVRNSITDFFRRGTNIMYFMLNLLNFLKERMFLNLTGTIDDFSFYTLDIVEQVSISDYAIIYLIDVLKELSENLIYSENQHDLLEITCMKAVSWIKNNYKYEKETKSDVYSEELVAKKETVVISEEKDQPEIKDSTNNLENSTLSSVSHSVEDIAGLLLNVDLTIRKKDEDRWNYVADYIQNKQYKRISGLLVNGKIVASGSRFLILVVSHELTAKAINNLITDDLAIKFIKTILDRTVLVMAISSEDWEKIKKTYIRKDKEKSLIPVSVDKINADFFLDFKRVSEIETTRKFDEATATDLEKYLNEEFKNEYEVK